MENYELYHYGVLGQKWGVRRYQAKDGSLTPAGKKRYARELEKVKAEQKVVKKKQQTKAKIDKLEAMKKEVADQKAELSGKKKKPDVDVKSLLKPKTKSVKDMSDQELKDAVARLELERRYNDLTPKQTSKGKQVVDKVLKDMAVPVAEDVGKQLMKSVAVGVINTTIKDESLKLYTNNKKK